MIDQFKAKTKTKKLVLLRNGLTTMIAEPQKKGKKPKLIDIAFGDFNSIVHDLKGQGYQIKILK